MYFSEFVAVGLYCLLAIATGSGSLAHAAEPARRPNILIFYLDDMAYGDPACYGGKLTPTPHIDSLATAGIRFTSGYVGACVCGPSRIGLVFGRYQARSGHDSNFGRPGTELKLPELTIADHLKATKNATKKKASL